MFSGAETLDQARDYVGRGSFMDMAAEIARYHHEKFDGSGYCEGLRATRSRFRPGLSPWPTFTTP